MTLRSRILLIAFVVWTAFVWVNRISNTLRSTTESAGAKTFSTILSAVILVLALGVVIVLVRSWSAGVDASGGRVLAVAAAFTVLVWLVRVPQILIADHAVGFKVVHVMLGLISVVLAAFTWQIGMVAVRSAGAARAIESDRV